MSLLKTTRDLALPTPSNGGARWSTSVWSDDGPVFRQLPHADGGTATVDPGSGERRGAARRDIELDIEIYGYDGELSLVHAYGTTQDISASGLFANVDLDLPVGSRAVIALQPSRSSTEPSILRGRVVRCHEKSEGYGLAIHFDIDAQQFSFEAA